MSVADLTGIEMALTNLNGMLAKSGNQGELSPAELRIFSDSQAAIQAVQNPKRPSGQYIFLQPRPGHSVTNAHNAHVSHDHHDPLDPRARGRSGH